MRIAFQTHGTSAAGPTLVLIHGWNCDRRYWASQMDTLAPDYRLVAIDLGGHGESGLGRSDWSIEAFGEDVAAVVRHLDIDDAVLIGHSMGGPVALEAAGRLTDRVTGVLGVDTFHRIEEKTPDDLQARLAPFREDLPAAVTSLVSDFFTAQTPQPLRDWITEDMAAAPTEVSVAALESLVRYDERDAIVALAMPVATINADIRPTDIEALRRARPGLEVAIIENTGHFLMMEQPEKFNRELRRILDIWTAVAGPGQ